MDKLELKNKMDKSFYLKELRLKKLNVGYPTFNLPHHLFDEVDLDNFIKDEKDRLPLFIGSQFGIYPKLEKVFSCGAEAKVIALLSKSLLSGFVVGLFIYLYSNGRLIKITSMEV